MNEFIAGDTYKFKKEFIQANDPENETVYTFIGLEEPGEGYFKRSGGQPNCWRKIEQLEPYTAPDVQKGDSVGTVQCSHYQYKERIQFAINISDKEWRDGFFITDLRNTPGFDGETPYLVTGVTGGLLYRNCVRKPLITITLEVNQEQLDAITKIMT
jgi:hypothetical protein